MGQQCAMDTLMKDTRTATFQQTNGLTMLNRHYTYNKGHMNCSADKGLTMLSRHNITRHTTNKGLKNG